MNIFQTKQALKIAKEGTRLAMNEIEKSHANGIFGEGDPNNPKYNNGYNYATGKYVELFGYKQDDLIAMQYK